MSVIDWSTKPEPWRWIGPQFRRECEKIVGSPPLPWQLLVSRREALGISRTELARFAGIHHSRVGAAERGEISPNPKHLAALDRLEMERQS